MKRLTRAAAVVAVSLLAAAAAPAGADEPQTYRGTVYAVQLGGLDRLARGKEVFKHTFTPATGLGPLYNSTGCGECHESPKPGGHGDEVEVQATAFRGGVCDPLVGEGGFVIQQHATPKLEQALGID